ncbi:MAG: ATPase, T2SS/T4P/T4SS family [bacterium]
MRALVSTGLVSEEKMMGFLSLKLGITKINLSKVVGIDSSVVEAIPESLAQAHLIFPIARRKDSLTLAVADPLDTLGIEKIKAMGYEVKLVLASEREIRRAIGRYYGKGAIVEGILKEAKPTLEREEEVTELEVGKEEVPAINLVNHMLIEAIKMGASDIHIEPFEESIWIRYRIDGVLHKVSSAGKHLQRGYCLSGKDYVRYGYHGKAVAARWTSQSENRGL